MRLQDNSTCVILKRSAENSALPIASSNRDAITRGCNYLLCWVADIARRQLSSGVCRCDLSLLDHRRRGTLGHAPHQDVVAFHGCINRCTVGRPRYPSALPPELAGPPNVDVVSLASWAMAFCRCCGAKTLGVFVLPLRCVGSAVAPW